MKFLLLGLQLPAVLEAHQRAVGAQPAHPRPGWRAQARAYGEHALQPRIFNFVKWLQVGEEACPTLEQAKARLKELTPPSPGGRTPRWSSGTASASSTQRRTGPWRRRPQSYWRHRFGAKQPAEHGADGVGWTTASAEAADAVVEGKPLAAGVGHCVAWPGAQQLHCVSISPRAGPL